MLDELSFSHDFAFFSQFFFDSNSFLFLKLLLLFESHLLLKLEDINTFVKSDHCFISFFLFALLCFQLFSQLLKIIVISVLRIIKLPRQLSQLLLFGQLRHHKVVNHLFDLVPLIEIILVKALPGLIQNRVLGFEFLNPGYQGVQLLFEQVSFRSVY